mmetsp:Transcript_122272/g.224154  ORF Transcript_122272/g.224154 Transcript_122272/m.224154 type:complete len:202 (+) Transcript_122272:178-783(+)
MRQHSQSGSGPQEEHGIGDGADSNDDDADGGVCGSGYEDEDDVADNDDVDEDEDKDVKKCTPKYSYHAFLVHLLADMGSSGQSPSCVPSMQIPYQSKCTVFNSILSGMFAVSRVYLRYFSMSSKKYTSVGPVRHVKLFSASIRLISELPPTTLIISLGFLAASSSKIDLNCHPLSSASPFRPVIARPLSFCTALDSSALRD